MTWEQGSMKFGHKYMKPPKISYDEWLKSGKSRIWISKSGEIPSQFLARIITDIQEEYPNILEFVEQEIKNRKVKK